LIVAARTLEMLSRARSAGKIEAAEDRRWSLEKGSVHDARGHETAPHHARV
jgi:hypothetical protein